MTLVVLAAVAILAQNPPPPAHGTAPGSERQAPADPGRPSGNGRDAAGQLSAGELDALRLQVLLDRAGFSPGVIDGAIGPNASRAMALYEQHRGGEQARDVTALTTYTITAVDTAGPFTDAIPADLMEQASLPALGYTSVLEALAERFHATPLLLQRLNPGARFAAGEDIQVPNVEPLVAPADTLHIGPEGRTAEQNESIDLPTGTSGNPGDPAAPPGAWEPNAVMGRPDVIVRVSGQEALLTVTNAAGELIFSAPVTTGSENDPLPVGEWQVTAMQFNPVFHYNPALFWDGDPSHSKARIAPGPNNPVGLVWIDLDKAHYGIHGTPDPAAIGRSQSHGCVRMTNWDALRLSAMVKPGTKVVFAP